MYYPLGFGPYMYLLLPAILLSVYAQTKVKTTFNKYLKVRTASGFTGASVARMILDRNALQDVRIEHISGNLSDHYNPKNKVLRLSSPVYNGNSIASLGVAAHEVGHAIQHGNEYAPLTIRNTIAPAVSFGSKFVWILVFAGFFFSIEPLISAGIILYLGVVIIFV